ncbi:MAG: ABC transporter ATP-binding protein, partial [Candidatus Omnitrophota bacterium]
MINFSRRHWHYLVAGFVCMLVSTVFEGAQLGAIMPVVDRCFNNQPIVIKGLPDFLVSVLPLQAFLIWLNNLDRNTIFYGMIWLTPVFFVLKGVFFYAQGYFMNEVAQRSVADVRGNLFRKYQDLSLDFYSQKRQGELMSRITNDTGYISNAISYGMTDVVTQSVLALVCAGAACAINWKLVLVVIVVFSFNAVVIYLVGKTIKKQSICSQESMADLSSILAETNQGVAIVKAFSREKHEIDRFDAGNNRYYKAMAKSIRRTLFLTPVSEFLAGLAIAAIVWFGGRDVLDGKMSFGVFVFFMGALMSILRPIKKLTGVYGINQQALAATKRIYDILDWKPSVMELPSAVEAAPPEAHIRFHDVSFKYEKAEERWIIKNFSHDFEVGKTTALVGPTGCGKTTVINMILRFYDPDKGVILFDDQDIKQVTVDSLRRHEGLVTQDMILFNESIRENLRYGKLDATDDEIIEAARQALALEFIERMPSGLDTVIGDRGFKLSGG